jgi:hypothetical protein
MQQLSDGKDRLTAGHFAGGAATAVEVVQASLGSVLAHADLSKEQRDKMTALLAKIRPAVEATQYTGNRSAKNYAFVNAVARKNVSPVGLVCCKSSAAGTRQR